MANNNCLWWCSLLLAVILTVYGAFLAVWYYVDLGEEKEDYEVERIPPWFPTLTSMDAQGIPYVTIPWDPNKTITIQPWVPGDVRRRGHTQSLSQKQEARFRRQQAGGKEDDDDEEIAEEGGRSVGRGAETTTYVYKTTEIYLQPKKPEAVLVSEASQRSTGHRTVPQWTYHPTRPGAELVTETTQRSTGHEHVPVWTYHRTTPEAVVVTETTQRMTHRPTTPLVSGVPQRSTGHEHVDLRTYHPSKQKTGVVSEAPQRSSGRDHVPLWRIQPTPQKTGSVPKTTRVEPEHKPRHQRPPPHVRKKERQKEKEKEVDQDMTGLPDDFWYWGEDPEDEDKEVCLPQGDRHLVFGCCYMLLGPLLFVGTYEKVPRAIACFLWAFTTVAIVHTVVAIISSVHEIDCGGLIELFVAFGFFVIAVVIVAVVMGFNFVTEKEIHEDQELLREENVDTHFIKP